MASLVGKDISVFTVQGQGYDSANGTWSGGAVQGLYGRWKELTVSFSNDWVDRTPSSGTIKEQRQTIQSFKGSIKGMIYQGQGDAVDIFDANTLLYMTFTTSTGRTMYMYAGITEAGQNWSKDAGDDSLDFECVGLYNGAQPWGYV